VKNISDQIPVYRVQLDGTAPPRPAPAAAAEQSPETPPADEALRERVRRLGRFYRHVRFAVVTFIILFAINLLASPGDWWVQWPGLGLAIAVMLSAVRLWLSPGDQLWEERRMRKLALREELRKRAEERTRDRGW
jgi:hypothetical protein